MPQQLTYFSSKDSDFLSLQNVTGSLYENPEKDYVRLSISKQDGSPVILDGRFHHLNSI